MPDTVDELLLIVDADRKPSPPSPSPSPDANDCTEQTLSRKREREVSLEPATPRTSSTTHALDVKSPAKKGRVHLDTTLEEVDAPDGPSFSHCHLQQQQPQSSSRSRTPSHPHSPALSVSPPHEVKVRQISQGVEDLKWQQPNVQPSLQDRGPESQPNADVIASAFEREGQMAESRIDDVGVDAQLLTQSQPCLKSPLPSPSPSQTQSLSQSQSQSGLASSLPPGSFVSVEDAAVEEADEAQDAESILLHIRQTPESDGGEPEKGLKRKLADRGASLGPESGPSTVAPTTETAKRPRDDADKDDNPRVSKRPSPPPEPNEASSSAPVDAPAPKLCGFMSYASTASPFASVKGQNVFSSGSSNHQKTPPVQSSSASKHALSLHDTLLPHPAPISPPFSQTSFSAFGSTQISQPATPGTATKRTGFEAFAGSGSPFASASPFSYARPKSPLGNNGSKNNSSSILGRSKSPMRRTFGNVSAFSTYANLGAHAFSAPRSKRARAESPSGGSSRSSLELKEESVFNVFGNGEGSGSGEEEGDADREESDHAPSSFGERLRASKDGEEELSEDEKEKLTEQEVITGEEEEETLLQVRGKLYVLCPQNQWKERGSGQLKLNVRRADGSGARLVMRKEAVYTLLLNVPLFQGMKCFLAQDPRYIRFSVIEDNKTLHFNLRVSNAKIAQELLDEINANIPP